mmetsp:Transcript_92903/g.220877  ORF Transcript_92903/g.220877 Transcript_92903/m.220877 type:complete len:240 (-) Transcript_92903:474-1193(-)
MLLWRLPSSGSFRGCSALCIINHPLDGLGNLLDFRHEERDLKGLGKGVQGDASSGPEDLVPSDGINHLGQSFSPQAFDHRAEDVSQSVYRLVQLLVRNLFVLIHVHIELHHAADAHSHLGAGRCFHHPNLLHSTVNVAAKLSVDLFEALRRSLQGSHLLGSFVHVLLVTVVVGLKLFHLLMQPEVGDYEVGIHHQKYPGRKEQGADDRSQNAGLGDHVHPRAHGKYHRGEGIDNIVKRV